jgi:UDP-glucose 4-epimerase
MGKGRVLIFGGSGFLGSAVAQEFIKREYSVYILDRFLQKEITNKVTFIECDITDINSYSRYLKKGDIILNMAGISDIEECQKDYLRTLEINVSANLQLLIQSKASGASRFIFASSMYANSSALTFYAASKISAESFIRAFHFQNPSFPIAILRFGSLYGPGSDSRNGIFRILSRAVQEKEIVVEGSPESTRQYIYISDAARACIDITESLKSFKTYNIVGDQRISSALLSQILQDLLNFSKNPRFIKSRFGHYRHSVYGYELTDLDYRSQEFINFESGIIATLDFIIKNRDGSQGAY